MFITFCKTRKKYYIHSLALALTLTRLPILSRTGEQSHSVCLFFLLPALAESHNKPELQDEVARLKAEIGSLHYKLNEMSNCEPATPVQRTWSAVVKTKRSQNRTATNTVQNHCDQKSAVAAKGSHQSDSRKQENTHSAPRPQRRKVRTLVQGARRVWGTLRACSATVVKNALSKSKPHAFLCQT